jgi:hypothetical protein
MGENVWMSSPQMKPPQTPVTYILPAGINTSWVSKNGQTALAANRQLSSVGVKAQELKEGSNHPTSSASPEENMKEMPATRPDRVLRE